MGFSTKRIIICIVIILSVFGVGYQLTKYTKEISVLKEDILNMESEVQESKNILSKISEDFDADVHKQVIKETVISASKIGEEIIAVDNGLTAFYKTSEDLPESQAEKDAIFENVDKLKKENTRLTGAKESDHINTWQLNPEWTLKLESVVNYNNVEMIPIVFSMTTKDGKNAGLIYAVYNVKDYAINNVVRHYTNAGMEDAASIGGR